MNADSRTPNDVRGLPLDPSPDERDALLDAARERLHEFLATIQSQPSWDTHERSDAASWVHEAPPEHGTDITPLLDLIFERIVPCAFNTAGPGYLAYIPGGGLYTAALAEFIASVVNRYAGVWVAAPGAVALETETVRWLAEILGFPTGTLGVLTTGGSMSNLLALVAARERSVGTVAASGTIYLSGEIHHSVTKAAKTAGIPEENWRTIPVDAELRLDVAALERAISADRDAGYTPFFVCGSAGTVNTGTIDPLDAIADVAAAEGLWFHVDGAYGGMFALVPELRDRLRGMERADSVAIDPHKGMFLAYGTGALLVRDLAPFGAAFASSAPYLPDFVEEIDHIDFCEVTFELSRAWRGLRLWLPLKLHGVRAFRNALREKHSLAEYAYREISTEPGIQFAAPLELSLFAFRKVWPGASEDELDRLNRAVLEHVQNERKAYITGTTIAGRFYVRICVLHLRTGRERVDEAIAAIRRAWASVR